MNRNICKKVILKTAGITILAALFYIACDDNGVTVVTPDVSTFTDSRDGKVYKKVLIGEQIWMAENLRYEADGSVCFNENGTFWSHKDPVQNCETYGRLYDWNTAMNGEASSSGVTSDVEGVCPAGWHLPSDAEWTELTDFVGVNAGTKLKSREFHDEDPPGVTANPDGTDKYRFSALPGGAGSYHEGNTSFIHLGWNGYWWTSTEQSNGEAWSREIMGTESGVMRGHMDKHQWFLSVRCVHD
jgi:uncharacterized protein (TIGR02145 family)